MDRRASAPVAISVVGLVATVVAAAVVLLAPRATTGEEAPAGVETEVPTSLADGTELPPVPDELADIGDRPVVVADRRDALPDGLSCHGGGDWVEEPEVDSVFVTPTTLHASLVGDASFPHDPDVEPERMRATCSATHDGRRWSGMGSSMGTEAPPGAPGTTNGGGSSCCRDGHGTARADVSVRGDDIAWLLQDRGPYWLAYPVEGLDSLTIGWPFPRPRGGPPNPPPVRVRVLDRDGEIVVDEMVGT